MALSQWTPAGNAEAVADPQLGYLVRTPGTDANAAVVEVITPIAAEIIGEDPTFAAAALAFVVPAVVPAVDARLVARDVVKHSDPTMPRRARRAAGFINRFGQMAARLNPTTNAWEVKSLRINQAESIESRKIAGVSRGTLGRNKRLGEDTLGADGNVPAWVLQRWASRMAVFLGGGNARPAWATTLHDFDSVQAVYNLNSLNMRKWTTALARATSGAGVARLMVEGTSVSMGAGANPMGSKWFNSHPGRLRRLLDTFTGYQSGTGIVAFWNSTYTTPAEDTRWSWGTSTTLMSGTDATTAPFAGILGRGALRLTNTDGNGWIAFEPTTNVSKLTVYATADAGATGVADVLIDGVSAGTFSVAPTASGGTLARRTGTPSNVIIVDVTVPIGHHKIRVNGPAASTVTIYAMKGSTGTGVEVSNQARSSSRTDEIILDDTTNHRYGMSLHFDAEPADLHILEMGMNDRGKTDTEFLTNARTAITRAKASGADVLLLADPEPNYTAPEVGASSLIPRIANLYALADEFNVPLLDLTWAWDAFTASNAAGLFNDNIHPSNLGLEKFARAEFTVITAVA